MKIKKYLDKLRVGPQFTLYLAAAVTVMFLSFYKLGTIVPGLSQKEVDFKSSSQSIRAIARNPDNAPYKIALRGLVQTKKANARNIRALSVAFGLLAIAFMYYSLKAWHDRRLAVMATFLFASSAWFLHFARIGLPYIMLLTGISGLIAYATWLGRSQRKNLPLLLGALLISFSFYVPGLFWFVLAGAVWQRKVLLAFAKKANFLTIILAITAVVISLAPIVWAGIKQPSVLDTIFGFNQVLHLNVKEALLNIPRIPYQLLYKGPGDAVLWLGKLPLLDVVTLVLAALGAYTYFYERKLKKVRLLEGIVVLSLAFIAINGSPYMIIILPVVYFLVACGLEVLFEQWFSVFPKNPFARITALSLILVTLFLAGFYHINHYFIAWPNAPETQAAFQIKDR